MTTLALPTRSTLSAAAAVAYAGALLYVVLLAVVHGVQPHMIHQATISKYALGRDGWLLQAAFVAAGLGYGGLARLASGRTAPVLWLVAAAFVVMGVFRIDAVGPDKIASVHGALHTIAFFVVVLLVHPLMFIARRRFRAQAMRAVAWVAPVLVVAGFVVPGIAGALLFRAWTLSLVAWVVLAARELDEHVRRLSHLAVGQVTVMEPGSVRRGG
jgi:hypothetical protein